MGGDVDPNRPIIRKRRLCGTQPLPGGYHVHEQPDQQVPDYVHGEGAERVGDFGAVVNETGDTVAGQAAEEPPRVG